MGNVNVQSILSSWINLLFWKACINRISSMCSVKGTCFCKWWHGGWSLKSQTALFTHMVK